MYHMTHILHKPTWRTVLVIALCAALFLLAPFVIYAQNMPPQNFKDIVALAIDLLEQALYILVALSMIVVLWGGVRLLLNFGDERGMQSGRQILLWGIIGLFVIFSVWGLVQIVQSAFFTGPAEEEEGTSNPMM